MHLYLIHYFGFKLQVVIALMRARYLLEFLNTSANMIHTTFVNASVFSVVLTEVAVQELCPD